MSSAYKNRRNETVRIIDHEPVSPNRTHKQDEPVFGKRTSQNTSSAATGSAQERPFDKNGISSYFINRVRARQAEEHARSNYKPSAIRQPGMSQAPDEAGHTADDRFSDGKVPYGALAAVFALAIALPVGFIWLTEQSSGPTIDRMTTASISATEGLRVDRVAMTRILKNGSFVVTVSGKISNAANVQKSLMPLTISLIDKDGVEVQSWRHRAGTGIVKPDGSIFFNTSAIDFSGRADTAHVVAHTVK